MRIRLDLDQQAYESLVASGIKDLRPPQMQAEYLIRRALDLPVPKDEKIVARELVAAGVSDE